MDTVQRHIGTWGTASKVTAQTTRIEMDVDDLSWVVHMLAAINADIHDAQPDELVSLLRAVGNRFVSLGC